MSEHQKQAAFLRALLDFDEAPEARLLQERLTLAERNERCLLSACRLVGMIGLLGFSGLGYSAVLLPEFFDRSSHVAVQLCSAMGLGSLMCLGVFLTLWIWYRAGTNKVREECRVTIGKMLVSRLRPGQGHDLPVVGHAPYLSICRIETTSVSGGTEVVTLRKAS